MSSPGRPARNSCRRASFSLEYCRRPSPARSMMQQLHERAAMSWSGMARDSRLGRDTTGWSRHAIRTSMFMAAASLSRRPASNIFMFFFPWGAGQPALVPHSLVFVGGARLKVTEKRCMQSLERVPFVVLFLLWFLCSLFLFPLFQIFCRHFADFDNNWAHRQVWAAKVSAWTAGFFRPEVNCAETCAGERATGAKSLPAGFSRCQ